VQRRRQLSATLVLLGAATFPTFPAAAASISWIAGSGQWNNDPSWDLGRDPIAGDDVDLINSGSINKGVTYVTDDENDVMSTVTIDAYSTGTMTLIQNNTQKLQTNIEYVGKDGTGTYLLQGGQNLLQGASELYVGFNTGADGTYQINNGVSLLQASQVHIGHSGTGTFLHSAGTSALADLTLGTNTGGDGSYELSGTGVLTVVGGQESIGFAGTGSFDQSGGTNTATSNLTLGFYSSGNGSYALSGGSLSTSHQVVGLGGTGSFNQSGGSNDTSGNLYLGANPGASGTYTISGGTYDIAGDIIGGAGQSTLNFEGGGTLTVGGLDITVDTFNVGLASISNGSYDHDPGRTLSADNSTIGVFGTGTFNQGGGTHSVGTSLSVGGAAGAQGTYNLSGTGTLSAPSQTIGLVGTGVFDQSGGTNTVTAGGDLELATNVGSSGTYTLSGGSLSVGGNIVGGLGASKLTIDGGALTVSGGSISVGTLQIGDASASNGSYLLSGASSVSADDELIGVDGIGSFNQTGGTNTVSSELEIGAGTTAGSSYALSGGTLSTWNTKVGGLGTGSFTHSAGSHTTAGGLGLTVGDRSGAEGTYDLSGTGELSTSKTLVGFGGTGTFLQSGGSHTVSGGGQLSLANAVGGDGTYVLSGGSLSAPKTRVGHNGSGSFTQSGGTHTMSGGLGNGLSVGTSDLGAGSYDLIAGNISTEVESIGDEGTGSFTQSGGTNTALQLGIGANSANASGTYDLSGGLLSMMDVAVGALGTGAFLQTGGTHSISAGLTVALHPGSSGSYALGGSGGVSSQFTAVGYSGTGSFSQTGGTHTMAGGLGNGLSLGTTAVGVGSYDLIAGDISTDVEWVGELGTGSFTQSGGTNTGLQLALATDAASASGTYELSGGLLSMMDVAVGLLGAGAFVQTGGTHSISAGLAIASSPGSSGSYDLSGGTLSVGGTAELKTNGTFTQTGGTLDATTFNQNGGTVNGTLQNQGTFNYISGSFNGGILNQGVLNLPSIFTLPDGLENHSSHTIASDDVLTLNGAGLLNLGTLSVDGLIDGTGPLTNSGFLIGSGEIGGSGGFTNTGLFAGSSGFEISNSGANANYGNLIVTNQLRLTGGSFSNGGTLDLGSGTVFGGATLTNTYGGTIVGRGTILNAFSNPGGVVLLESGTTNISQAFFNDGLIQLTGFSANLTGGTISNAGTIQGLGHVGNAVVNALGGTIEAIGGTLTLSGSVSNDVYGLVTAASGGKVLALGGLGDNKGLINLGGGTYDNNGWNLTNTGQISGHGTFRSSELINDGSITLTGGAVTVNGNVTNNLGRQIEVAHDTALFTDDVTNFGIFKTTNAIVTFSGTYTENGGFISDPSDNHFEDIILGDTGYLVGGEGDRFFVTGDLLSSSSVLGDWETLAAELIFEGGGSHTLRYTGADFGASGAGYDDNFAWGVLELGAADSLWFEDGDATAGGALYVDVLRLLGGVGQIASISGNGMSIYYDPFAADNQYLGGQSYALSGGGVVAPVPEPGTAALLGLGLLVLALQGRGGRRRGRP
jgi:fibronectin-binding autotransporter adhesin